MSAHRRGAAPWRSLTVWAALAALFCVMAAGAWAMSRTPAPATAAAVRSAAAAAVVQAPRGAVLAAARAQSAGCEQCHGELELLRQQVGSLNRARALLVPQHVVAGSAHGDMSCAECHTGFAAYPHAERATATASCASCHAPADTLWQRGAHAHVDDQVTCAQCHSAHDVKSAELLRSQEGAYIANAPCISCHESDALPRHEPHSDLVSCASCHAAHDVLPVDDPDSWLAAAHQMRTCGACHDTIATVWQRDIHGDAALRAAHTAGRQPAADMVSCTSCHTGHQMLAITDTAFAATSVQRCAACHEKATRTFFGSYHGKATSLGSTVSAACHDCHSAHEILPDSMPASHVNEDRLVATCRQCHEHARPAFVKYDSHPDPFNRARNPWLFYAFFGMNGLLAFVLIVFGGHTVLWWIRLWLDKRRGIVHGPGGGHGGQT
jgi:predicted CXXCH cytochrome family protein